MKYRLLLASLRTDLWTLSNSFPHCKSLYTLIYSLLVALDPTPPSLNRISSRWLYSTLYIIYSLRANIIREGVLSRTSLSIRAISPVAYFISFAIQLYRVVLLLAYHRTHPTYISQLLIPMRTGITGEFCVFIAFLLVFSRSSRMGLSGTFLLPRFAVTRELHL